MSQSPWIKTNDYIMHCHVYYHIWKSKDMHGREVLQTTTDPNTPPMHSGGYFSKESLLKYKFDR